MSFKNLPMLWKIVSLLLLLGVANLACTYYSSTQMTRINDDYTALIKSEGAAALSLTDASRWINTLTARIYRQAATTSDEDNRDATAERKAAIEAVDKSFAAARAAEPDFATRIDAVKAVTHKAYEQTCDAAITQAVNSLDEANVGNLVRKVYLECVPAMRHAIAEVEKLADDVTESAALQSQILTDHSKSTMHITFAIVVGATVLVIAIAWFMTLVSIVRPLRGVVEATERLGHDQLDMEIAGRERRDEIGAVAKVLDVLRRQLHDARTARENLAVREREERQRLGQRAALAEAFVNRMQSLAGRFTSSSGEVASAARNLSATAEETSRQAQSVAAAAEQASANVQTVAAATEEMVASVREIASQIGQSTKVAEAAFEETEASNHRIEGLAKAASAIGNVIQIINSIAAQTNLLALNATIEAARAGDAGKGFAVVAAEVKTLADQTAKATDEISSMVAEIQKATEGTVKSMAEITGTITSVRTISAAISGAVEEQSATTSEIAANCQQAAVGTQQVTQNITGVGDAAESTGVASAQLLSLSDNLSGQADELRQTVEAFVRDLEAA